MATDYKVPYHLRTTAVHLPLILKRLVERAFICDPVQTDHDLNWLSRYWNSEFSPLSLALRLDRQAKYITCLEDCTDMVMLETINARLAAQLQLRQNSNSQASEISKPAAVEKREEVVFDLVDQVEESITRNLEGKTVGVKLLPEERARLKELMTKHGVSTIKDAVLTCIKKGLAVWEAEV